MVNLSNYKELFYRDRTLDEFRNDPKWGVFYYKELHWLTLQDMDFARNAETILNKTAFCCTWFLSPVSITEVEDFCRKIDLEHPSPAYSDGFVLFLVNSIIKSFSYPTPRAEIVFSLVDNILSGSRKRSPEPPKTETLFDLADFTPHPDLEVLRRRKPEWWAEVTNGFKAQQARALSRLYTVPEENQAMKRLVTKAYRELPRGKEIEVIPRGMVDEKGTYISFPEWEDALLPADSPQPQEPAAEEEKAENGHLNIQQLILLFMEMLDLTLDPTFTNQSELARLIAAVSGFKFESIRPKIAKGISYDKKQVKQDAQRVASLLEKVKPGLAERIRRNINEE